MKRFIKRTLSDLISGKKHIPKMKISRVFMIAFVLFFSTISIYAQEKPITLNLKDVTIKQLLKEIESQTDYTFVYNNHTIDTDKKISVKAENEKISSLLGRLFPGFSYTFEDKMIILKPKEKRSAPQQEKRITGEVKDQNGEPLIGVSVHIKDTSIGTITGIDGTFSLQVTGNNPVIKISYIGFIPQEITVGDKSKFNIVLNEDKQILDEVIVIGYGTKNKNKVIGAVNQVGSETFENKAVTNMAQALQGAIPNLNITFSDGQLNSSPTYNIRGFTSINGGTPLALIDGVPGDLNLLSPEDIASVSVLKDASSAAIYGAQAAFGVILITTKKGESEKPRFRFSMNAGYNQPLKTPKLLLDNLQYAKTLQLGYNGYTGTDNPSINQVIDYLEAYKEDPTIPQGYVNDLYFSFISGEPTDWYDMIYNDKQSFQRYFVDVSGKNDKMNYYLSAGFLKQDGVYKVATDVFKKYNLKAKMEIKLSEHITIFENFTLEESKYDYPVRTIGSSSFLRLLSQLGSPFSTVYDTEGNYTYGGMVSLGLLKEGGRSVSKKNVVQNTLGFEVDLLKNSLKIKGDYSIWLDKIRGDEQKRRLSYASSPGVTKPLASMADFYKSSYTEAILQTINIYADYTTKLNKHNLNFIAGYNQNMNDYEQFWGQVDENAFDNYGSLNLGNGLQYAGDNQSAWATSGFFYRGSYDFDSKYLLELNGRVDGSSRFPQGNRWGFFPSAAVGWVVSQEKFMDFLKPSVDLFKVRASYGSLGNQQVSAFMYIPTMAKGKMSYLTNGQQLYYVSPPSLVANDLTWETVISKNAGFDLAMFRNRLNFGFDVYERVTKDMLAAGVSLPATLGGSVPKTNSADLSVKGWEASVMWRDNFKLFGKPGNYSARFVIADNSAKITRFDGNHGQLLSGYNVGEKIGTIWGLKTLGFFESDEEAQAWADQTEVGKNMKYFQAGDIKFEDKNKDGKITKGKQTLYDHGDLERIGNTSARFPYSLDLLANWNNFDLNIFLQGVGKRDFYPGGETAYFWGFYNRWYNPVFEHIEGNYWTPENTNAYFPRPRAYTAIDDQTQLGVPQTRYLQDASYLRLKTLTFGYTIPKHLTRKLGLEKFRLYFTGQNLLTFTNLSKVFDPEAINSTEGTAAGFIYPIQKTLTFGLEVVF